MKVADIRNDYKQAHVIEQLEKLGSYDNEHYTYNELVRKLAAVRAMNVDVESDSNKYF
ncbi:hypothetical protein [Virgibacillus sp. CBA3643]|uniref:hypothetical protein n=1 Tax=Virgibacillus sp. CBA3643 TaxID=2942278 RepID=UPI0035A354A9